MQSSSETYTIPTHRYQSGSAADGSPGKKKPWRKRVPILTSKHSVSPTDSQDRLGREHTRGTTSSMANRKWWRIRLFRGMINDIRRRAPFYWSDWSDAWDYRVIPATVYMYFAKYVFNLDREAKRILYLHSNQKALKPPRKNLHFICELFSFSSSLLYHKSRASKAKSASSKKSSHPRYAEILTQRAASCLPSPFPLTCSPRREIVMVLTRYS